MSAVKRYVARANGLDGMMPVNERYTGIDKQYVLASDYDALAAEVERLRKDAERLDWLAYQFRTCTMDMGGNHPYAPGHEVRRLRGPTFRHAIDAAMAQQEPSA